MTVDLQLKINSDPRLKSFIRENPIWYKRLNRNPELFKEFTMDMKNKYKLTTSDKINKTLNSIGMLQSFLEVLR
ncbi:MAG: YlbE-like family protein [Bacilli bacterium]|nr:YlbE-like family protein [Bacilli bacterium]